MRRFLLVGLLLVGSASISFLGAEPPSNRLLTQPTVPTDAELARMGLRKVWTANVGTAGRRDGLASVQAFADQIVTQTIGGAFTALNAETGAPQWRLQPGDAFAAHQRPAGANRHYFFLYSGKKLFGVERKSGLVEWTVELPLPLDAAPSADEASLYLTTSDHKIRVYFLPLTRQLKSETDHHAYEAMLAKRGLSGEKFGSSQPKELWSFDVGSAIAEPPAAFGSHIILGDSRGTVCCFENGRRYMSDSFRTGGGVAVAIAQDGDSAYVASNDHHVYAVELVAGRMEPRWQFAAGSRITQKPMVAEGDVFVAAAVDGLHRVDRDSGKLMWSQPRAKQVLAATPRLVIAADGDKRLLTLDRQRGLVLGSWDAGAYAFLLGNEHSDRAYLANHNGLVVCLCDADPSCAAPHKREAKLSTAMAAAARDFAKNKQAAEQLQKEAAERTGAKKEAEGAEKAEGAAPKAEGGDAPKKDNDKPAPMPPPKSGKKNDGDAKPVKAGDKKDDMKDKDK